MIENDIKELITKCAKEPYYIPGERTKNGKDLYVVRVDYKKGKELYCDNFMLLLTRVHNVLSNYFECVIVPTEIDFAEEMDVKGFLESYLKEN